jgi:hypothetical protein
LKRDLETSLKRTHASAQLAHTNGHGNGDGLRARFETFWAAYPKKTHRDAAWHVWRTLQPDAALTGRMVATLAWRCREDDWLRERGRYQPLPVNWLNGRGWEDEPNTTPHVSQREIALGRTAQEFLK